MPGGRQPEESAGWRQLSLVGPTCIRISTVVWLDGLRGEAQHSTLVTHGVERFWVSCDVVPGVELGAVAVAASRKLSAAVTQGINVLSPF